MSDDFDDFKGLVMDPSRINSKSRAPHILDIVEVYDNDGYSKDVGRKTAIRKDLYIIKTIKHYTGH